VTEFTSVTVKRASRGLTLLKKEGRQMKKSRSYRIAVSVLLVIIFALAGAFAALLDVSEVAFNIYPDGTVMFGTPVRSAITRPPVQSPLQIPIASPPPPSALSKGPGEKLTSAEIYEKAAPAVVLVAASTGMGGGTGTGIVITEDGYIVTNHHVVDGAQTITVALPDGLQYTAELIGSDRLSDLAVLKIHAEGLAYISFGSSDSARPGDPVAVIGNPLGTELSNTITTGVISGINRDITIEGASGDITMTVLQTSCAVNPGNSGGPLLNEYGLVVGIISSKIMGSRTQAVEGLGFAIPSDTAVPLVEMIIEHGYVKGRAALGITVDTTYQPVYDMPPGVRVVGVDERADVYTKGLLSGDIITHVDGSAVENIGDLNAIRNTRTAGETLRLTVWRQGNVRIIEVVLMEEGALR
jgi:serine protease Do